MDEIRIIIAGGGTGGHLFPAIAIGEKIQSLYKNSHIHYMGSISGIESKVLPVKLYPHTLLPIRGIQRNFSFNSILKNIGLPYFYLKSLSIAQELFNELLPNIVVGTGGYASAIPIKLGIKNKLPVVLQEQNSYPGLTTRVYASRANIVCTAFGEAHSYLNEAKCLLTGNPIRSNISQGLRENGAKIFKLNASLTTLFVFGGSQGSIVLNQLIENLVNELKITDFQVLWQTGSKHYNRYKHLDSDLIRVLPFIDSMADAYALSDLIFSRSGALTISEIMAVGKASILLPFSKAAENHQYKNAKTLADYNAAVLLEEKTVNSEIVYRTIKNALNNKNKLMKMGQKAKSMRKLNATENIANHIIELALA